MFAEVKMLLLEEVVKVRNEELCAKCEVEREVVSQDISTMGEERTRYLVEEGSGRPRTVFWDSTVPCAS